MDRDFVGYANRLPKVVWPDEALIAVNFVVNYEEGAEQNVMDGDQQSECYLTDLPSLQPVVGDRHLSSESLFEYGSRAGIWRLLNLFDEFNINITIFATALALERNIPLATYLKSNNHEIAGHGYRWINYREMDIDKEQEHITKTIDVIQQLTSKKVQGWYTGRKSINTRSLIVAAGLKYDSDSYADDLPYWECVTGKQHLIIPYVLDTNDARYAFSPGWSNGNDFFCYLKDAFDCLFHEGMNHPKMMTVALHPRLSGRPGRCEAIRRFITYVRARACVDLPTRGNRCSLAAIASTPARR